MHGGPLWPTAYHVDQIPCVVDIFVSSYDKLRISRLPPNCPEQLPVDVSQMLTIYYYCRMTMKLK